MHFKTLVLSIILFLLYSFSAAQSVKDSSYFDADWKKCSKKDARYIREISKLGNNYLVKDLYLNHQPQMSAICSVIEPELVFNGPVFHYEPNGDISKFGRYKNGNQYGLSMRTGNKGGRKDTTYSVYYLDGNFSYDWRNVYMQMYGFVAPQYLGGYPAICERISKNLNYPAKSKAERIGGKLDVHFMIDTSGKISDAHVLKGINKEIDAEGIRLVNTLDTFVPASYSGQKQKSSYCISIYFFPDTLYSKTYFLQESKKNTYKAFFDMNRNIVDSVSASFYTIYNGDDEKYKSGLNETYWMTGTLLSREEHHLNASGQREETISYFFDDEKLRSHYYTIESKKNGDFKEYHSNGVIKREEVFQADTVVKGFCYTRSGMDTTYFKTDERHAQFPGGIDNYVKQYPIYHQKGKRRRISGLVTVQFVVDKYGVVKDVKIKDKANAYLAKEAVRIISEMPQWTQGYMFDHASSSIFVYPIHFHLK